MKFATPLTVEEIAQRVNARAVIGDDSLLATGINEIHKVEEGDIAFSDNAKYFSPLLKSAATILLLNEEVTCPPGKVIIVCDAPFEAYNNLVQESRPFRPHTANISDTAKIHPTAIIEPNAVVGHYAEIGANSHIQANSFVGDYSIIGERVNIQPGALIGTTAFYYKREKGKDYVRWHTGGRVVIEDDVEIGAGCTINAGVSGDTFIGRGTKFDSQIHIGHDAVVGRRCLFAAQVGIGGNTVIGDNVVLYGQVGVAQNLHIADDVVVYAKSGVSRDLEAGKVYFGSPAEEFKDKAKQISAVRRLPSIINKFNT